MGYWAIGFPAEVELATLPRSMGRVGGGLMADPWGLNLGPHRANPPGIQRTQYFSRGGWLQDLSRSRGAMGGEGVWRIRRG